MGKTILITGATGLIGGEIVRQCQDQDIVIHYLTTSKDKIENKPNYKGFYWNPKKKVIDEAAFKDVSAIINLVGATISKRWTKKYKKIIIESRTETANLIFETLKNIEHKVTQFISASGVNIYSSSETKLYTEEDKEVDDSFLATVVVLWENAANQFVELGIDVAKVRTGAVLAKEDGALMELMKPIKLGVGSPIGSGDQWMSWIHLQDIAGIYLYILNNELEGVYNAVSPNPVTNKKMVKQIADQLDKPLFMPNFPSFMLHLMLGEMAVLVTEGNLVSSKKIEELGYKFNFYNLETALLDLIH